MSRIFGFSCLITLLLVAACSQSDPLRQTGVIQLSDAFSAEFELVDHFGEPATSERFRGKPMLIYFGFASCPDVCPASLSVMSASLEALGRDADRLQPLFITVDPERDTGDVLRAHLSFDERILGLTGDQQAIDFAIKNMKAYAKKVPMPDSALEYSVDHLDLFYFVDADGTPLYAFNGKMAPADLARALKSLIN